MIDIVKRLRTQPPRYGPSASTDILRDEAAAERERCAKIAFEIVEKRAQPMLAVMIAEAIRNQSE